jgi:hypothetical protein
LLHRVKTQRKTARGKYNPAVFKNNRVVFEVRVVILWKLLPKHLQEYKQKWAQRFTH